MAKKGQAIQLQTEVNNDEDWEKLLQRDGLIVVDIYSDWCGPCSGMTATLKKLKLEIGGDVLQLAVAKADTITALQRFRNKSEPTWMFIVNGKMVNFMFGPNAPKLTRLIIDELRKENEAREGRRERVLYEINELADEEKERLEVTEALERQARQKEEEKAAKELYERRVAECNNILENLQHLGVILIFPHARTAYQEAFGDLLGEAGLTITQTEKIELTQQILDELFYFDEECPFSEESVEKLINDTSVVLLIKPIPARDLDEATDDILLRIVYGAMKKPPGSPDSPAKVLANLPQVDEEGNEIHVETVAIWTPESAFIKATALRLFFPKYTEHYLIAPPEPTPPHFAVVFESFRRQEVAEIMEKYPEEILRYGFFTSEKPEEAKLVAKTIKKYEKCLERTPDEKLVIQLAKRKSECVLAFAQLKPFYISPNTKEGKRECDIFFPEDYDEPPEEEEEEEEEEKPPEKPKRKKKKVEGEEGETEGEEEGDEEDAEVAAEGEEQIPIEGEPTEGGEAVEVVPEEGAEAAPVAEGQAATEGEVPAPSGEIPTQEAEVPAQTGEKPAEIVPAPSEGGEVPPESTETPAEPAEAPAAEPTPEISETPAEAPA